MCASAGYVWELHKAWRFNRFLRTSGIESYLDSLGLCLQRAPLSHEVLLDGRNFVTVRLMTVSLQEVFLQFQFGRCDNDYNSIYGSRVVRLKVLIHVTNEISCLASPSLNLIYVKRMAFPNQQIALLFTHIDFRNKYCLLPKIGSVAYKVYSLLSSVHCLGDDDEDDEAAKTHDG